MVFLFICVWFCADCVRLCVYQCTISWHWTCAHVCVSCAFIQVFAQCITSTCNLGKLLPNFPHLCLCAVLSEWAWRYIRKKMRARWGEGRRWMRGLKWKPETVGPHLEAELAASGPWAVTHGRSKRVVPRTFSSGETEKTSARGKWQEKQSHVFSHIPCWYTILHPLSFVTF